MNLPHPYPPDPDRPRHAIQVFVDEEAWQFVCRCTDIQRGLVPKVLAIKFHALETRLRDINPSANPLSPDVFAAIAQQPL